MEVLVGAGTLILGFICCQKMGKARPDFTHWMRMAVKVTDAELKLCRNVGGDCRYEMWHENRHYFKDLLENGLAENIKARLGERFGNIKGSSLIALWKTKRRKRCGEK